MELVCQTPRELVCPDPFTVLAERVYDDLAIILVLVLRQHYVSQLELFFILFRALGRNPNQSSA